MADPYTPYHFPAHAHYRQDPVAPQAQQQAQARSPVEYAHTSPQHHMSPYSENDYSDYNSPYILKGTPFDASGPLSPPQRAVFPTFHKDQSYASDIDTRSLATSRFPAFNTQPLPPAEPEKPPGMLQKWLPSSMACRLYLLTVLVETIVDIAIEVDLYLLIDNATSDTDEKKFTRLPTYLSVFGMAHLFQFVLAIDAVHAQNTLQFMFLAVFNAALLGYAVIQKSEISATIDSTQAGLADIPVNALTIIIIVVVALSQVAYIGLAWKIYTEFGWKVYKLLGADRSLKRMFMHLQIFLCLCKFDVFFFVGFGVQWIFLILQEQDFEYYLTIAALPLSVVLLVIGHIAAHKENKWLMGFFVTGSTIACVYYVYKLWKIFAFRNDEAMSEFFKSLLIFNVLAIMLLATTFAWSMIVMHNFGQGLRARVSKSKHRKGASMAFSSKTGRTQLGLGGPFEMKANPNRLSID